MDSAEFLYQEMGIKYNIGLLSNNDNSEIEFYQNDFHPGGNSYYVENSDINPAAAALYNDSHKRKLKSITLDSAILAKQLPLPDLIKMDVQGSELDILKGATETLKTVKHVILGLQMIEYNKGGPLHHEVIAYMSTQGFDCTGMFCDKGPDGEYHFIRKLLAPMPITLETPTVPTLAEKQDRLRELGSQRLIPQNHVEYLLHIRDHYNFTPSVIYDVGACVLHWTNEAVRVWPNAEYVVFEAMDISEFLFKERNLKYNIGVCSDVSGKEVDFYQNDYHPGGNSYYKENEEVNPEAPEYFNETHRRRLLTVTLDEVGRQKSFPSPQLLKMDVQGAELDVLKGAVETLKFVQHVILELQVVEYNKGAPLRDYVIDYMNTQGFDCAGIFSNNGPDGDYHFIRR